MRQRTMVPECSSGLDTSGDSVCRARAGEQLLRGRSERNEYGVEQHAVHTGAEYLDCHSEQAAFLYGIERLAHADAEYPQPADPGFSRYDVQAADRRPPVPHQHGKCCPDYADLDRPKRTVPHLFDRQQSDAWYAERHT